MGDEGEEEEHVRRISGTCTVYLLPVRVCVCVCVCVCERERERERERGCAKNLRLVHGVLNTDTACVMYRFSSTNYH